MLAKKTIIILSVIVILIISRMLFGVLKINVTIPYKNPTYTLKINNTLVKLDIETRKKTTLIPYLVQITNHNILITTGDVETYKVKLGDEISVNVKGYNCYFDIDGKEKRIACTNNSNKEIKNEINDIKYSLKIMQKTDLIYEGEYVEDLSEIITKSARYQIFISASYKNIESDLIFFIDVE